MKVLFSYDICSNIYFQRNNGKEDLDDKFAAKFISCEGASARLRVREEIDILFSLHHPNILRYWTTIDGMNIIPFVLIHWTSHWTSWSYCHYLFRLFAAYEEEKESTTEIVQILEYLSGGQLFEKIIESPYSKFRV